MQIVKKFEGAKTDGPAVRELLKYRSIEEIILVDLDEAIIQLVKENHYLTEINEHSLSSPKVIIINSDAFSYLLNN